MAEQYNRTLYVRTVNPGQSDEFLLVGTQPSDVEDSVIQPDDSAAPTVARYVLAGTGRLHFSAPVYVEDERA